MIPVPVRWILAAIGVAVAGFAAARGHTWLSVAAGMLIGFAVPRREPPPPEGEDIPIPPELKKPGAA